MSTTSKVKTHTRHINGRSVKVRSHHRANHGLARRGVNNIGRAWKSCTKKQKAATAGFLGLAVLELTAWGVFNAAGLILGALAAILVAVSIGAFAYANGGDK